MHKHGFASPPTSISINDGLVLYDAHITAVLRCTHSQNKSTRIEMENYFAHLQDELKILKNITVILCLGKIAYDTTCKLLKIKPEKFGHNKVFVYDNYTILTSHHPSKQNT